MGLRYWTELKDCTEMLLPGCTGDTQSCGSAQQNREKHLETETPAGEEGTDLPKIPNFGDSLRENSII